MSEGTTLATMLHEGAEMLRRAGIEDAGLEADVLARHALNLDDDRARMLARLQEPVDAAAAERFEGLVRRRLAHEPTAYIIGFREFYGLKLECTPEALIPRPETELLVELALEWLARAEPPVEHPLIVDVGTGSGALAIALAVHCPRARVVAIDASMSALQLALRNTRRHGVESPVALICGDLLPPLRISADVMVANLPYVTEADWEALPPEIRSNEPRSALVGGPAGTETIRRLLNEAAARMEPRSMLLCEFGDLQADALRAAAVAAIPDARIEVRRDLAGLDRLLYIER